MAPSPWFRVRIFTSNITVDVQELRSRLPNRSRSTTRTTVDYVFFASCPKGEILLKGQDCSQVGLIDDVCGTGFHQLHEDMAVTGVSRPRNARAMFCTAGPDDNHRPRNQGILDRSLLRKPPKSQWTFQNCSHAAGRLRLQWNPVPRA